MAIQRKKLRRFQYRFIAIQFSKNGQIPKERTGLLLAKVGAPAGLAAREMLGFWFFQHFQPAEIARAGKVVAVSSPALGDSVFEKLPNREKRNQNCKRHLLRLNLKS